MQTLAVGEFESRFLEVLDIINKGGEVFLTYGNNKEIVGQFIPIAKKRKLGIWKDEMTLKWEGDGKITLEEFLGEE
jgi:antitoxin (DNA-binding transcriptional repressor) of toxin-antitoxin stability system